MPHAAQPTNCPHGHPVTASGYCRICRRYYRAVMGAEDYARRRTEVGKLGAAARWRGHRKRAPDAVKAGSAAHRRKMRQVRLAWLRAYWSAKAT